MTHQNQIIIFCILAVIAAPLGTFTIIKTIKNLSRPPVNVLHRRGDIELGEYIQPTHPNQLEYIEPIRPNHIYQPLDIETLNYESYNWGNRVSTYWSDRVPTYYSGQPAPSYYTGGNPPSFNSVDRINCWLENENIFNSYFTFLIFIIIIFTIIFFKINSLYSMLLMIPFSTFEIDFRDSFEWKFNSYKVKPTISFMKLQSLTKDIDLLLLSLLDDNNYSMSFSFISSYKEWEKDKGNNPLFC